MIVSAYFSHLYSHPDYGWPRLRHYRPYLRSLSKRDGLLAEMEFSAMTLSHMLIWDYTRPNILELRLSEPMEAEHQCFERIFRFLDLVPRRLSGDQLAAIVDRFSFRQFSGGRERGIEDPFSHYRKGQAGDWRNHFEQVHIDYFKKLYNTVLLKLGYETDENWDRAASPLARIGNARSK